MHTPPITIMSDTIRDFSDYDIMYIYSTQHVRVCVCVHTICILFIT